MSGRRLRWWRVAVGGAVALVAGTVTGISIGHRAGHDAAPAPVHTGPSLVYLAVGASDALGVGSDEPARDAWPLQFARMALPVDADVVDVAEAGTTVADALDDQLPLAEQVHADVVTIWLGVNDAVAAIAPADYERSLAALVAGLQHAGARVFLANLPDVSRLPSLSQRGRPVSPAAIQRTIAAYNEAIGRIVASSGAMLVDLAGAAARLTAGLSGESDVLSADGFHPNTAGHTLIAQAFTTVYKAQGVGGQASP